MAYEQKTLPHDGDVAAFLAAAEPPARRDEGRDLLTLFTEVTGVDAQMWGTSIVGFGRIDYTYPTGHSGSMAKVGFSPRRSALTLYGLTWPDADQDQLGRLGRHRLGKGCLYLPRLADVDREVLRQMVARAWASDGPTGS